MALSSEQLLNVGARGIEDGGEVSGRHLDCSFSRGRDDGRKMSRFGRSRVGYIFLGRASCRRSFDDFGTQIQFCGEPRQGCAIDDLSQIGPSPAVGASSRFQTRCFAESGAWSDAKYALGYIGTSALLPKSLGPCTSERKLPVARQDSRQIGRLWDSNKILHDASPDTRPAGAAKPRA